MTVGHLWTASDVSEYLRVSRAWVYQRVSRGDIPHLRIRGCIRFIPDAIMGWAQRKSAPGAKVLQMGERRGG